MHVLDYAAFRQDFGVSEGESELHLLEKFHATRILSGNEDVDTFIDPVLYDPEHHDRKVTSDVAGVEDGKLTAVFCETKPPGKELLRDLHVIDEAENSRAVVVYPFRVNSSDIDANFKEAVNSGRFVVEHLNWQDRVMEKAFRQAIELIDLLCNETRAKMLIPLLERPHGKKDFREEINPKLIYENVPLLRTRRIIAELEDDLYDLTPLGKSIMGEYLAFVEKVRKLIERTEKEEE